MVIGRISRRRGVGDRRRLGEIGRSGVKDSERDLRCPARVRYDGGGHVRPLRELLYGSGVLHGRHVL